MSRRTRSSPGTDVGILVREWTEGGRVFRIEKLVVPKQVGGGERFYRLSCDGAPAPGGQWHFTVEDAENRAAYVLETGLRRRIEFLENSVNRLQGQLHAAKRRIAELEKPEVVNRGNAA